jgi:signal transduction histidine kinase/ActR/RegA family two-component response regulator
LRKIRRNSVNGVSIPKTSIRLSLVLGSISLIVGAIAVFSIGLYVAVYRPLLNDLTALVMRRASERVTMDVETIFRRVEAVAARERDWGRNGLVDLDDLDRFNRLLSPLFSGNIGISSMAVAQDSGREVLIVSQPEHGWFNRLTDPDAWGNRGRFLTWDEHGALVSSEQREVDYDARQRPWFAAAMALSNDTDLYWTPPYRFVSTGELGMSAVVRWTSPKGQKTAMATDIRLLDVTRLAQKITVGKSGLAAVLTEDGKVLGLPRDPLLATDDAIMAAGLMPVDELAVLPLTLAFRSWQSLGRPDSTIETFDVAGTPWLATFHPIHLTNQTFWVAALAPAADFMTLTANSLALGAALVLGSILIASIGAIWLGSRFSGPIEQLTEESVRIGRMNLSRPITVQSPVREIDALAQTLEDMRRNLVEARAELEAKAELERQLEQSRKLEVMGQLAAGIAHDFNNILGAILGFAGFLRQDIPAGTPQHGFVERIIAAAERARDFVRQILAFARRSGVERKPGNLVEMVQEAHALLHASLPSSTHLELKREADELVANVNAAQISQVLFNLCLNANDALLGAPGSIVIGISRVLPGDADFAAFPSDASTPLGAVAQRDGLLWFGALDPERAYGRLTITDTGAGMDALVLQRIFDPYFTTKARDKGTGLGLAVVHGIVTEYGGACIVNSHPGAGTRFTIYIPLEAGMPLRAVATSDAPAPRGDERVLVIDDDANLAEILCVGLGRLGYRSAALSDPEQALAAFIARPTDWDVVVCDQVMPKLDGLSVLRRMKAIRPALPFILCTGWADGASEQTAGEAGAAAFFVKPVAPERIAAVIRRLLDAQGLSPPSDA